MKHNLFDMVLFNKKISNYEEFYDKIGVIIEVYTTPNLAYEVEFCNDEGETISTITLPEVEMDNFLIIPSKQV